MSRPPADRPGVGCVDVLAEALGASGSADLAAVLVRAGDPWGFWLDATRSVALVAVTHGVCFLRRPAARPVELTAGDVALVPTTRPGQGLAGSADGKLASYDAVFSALGIPAAAIDLSSNGTTTSVVHVAYEPASADRRLRAGLPDLVVVDGAATEHSGVLDATLRLLAHELVHDHPGARTATHRLVDVLVVHVLRAWMAGDHPTGSRWQPAAPIDEPITAALDRIHTQPARPWTIGSLAADVGLSRAAFVRRFTGLVGEPPSAYQTRWRLAIAARCLRDTTEPLVTIAREVGYSSEFTFSRAFNRTYGQPPGRYRASVRHRAKD